jgi:hypothetical protein
METAPCDYSCLFLLHSQLTVDVVRGILWRLCQDDVSALSDARTGQNVWELVFAARVR